MFKKVNLILLFFVFGLTGFNIASAQESKDPTDPVRDKVKERIENVLKNPKAYLGTITDKTEDTLQIKNLKGEIQFISVNADKSSFQSVGKTSRAIKFDDVGLGDFVVAMGFQKTDGVGQNNGNFVLEAKRVLVTEEIGPPVRKITFGEVVNIEKKILTLKSDNQEYEFEFPKSWKGPEIAEISEGDRVAVVSLSQEGKTIIRTIEITSETPSPTPEE
jgi:hypothetical protein